jgi:hypothetical protein
MHPQPVYLDVETGLAAILDDDVVIARAGICLSSCSREVVFTSRKRAVQILRIRPAVLQGARYS